MALQNTLVFVAAFLCLPLLICGTWTDCGHMVMSNYLSVTSHSLWLHLGHMDLSNTVQLYCDCHYMQHRERQEAKLEFTLKTGERFYKDISLVSPCLKAVCQWNPTVSLSAPLDSKLATVSEQYEIVRVPNGLVGVHLDYKLSSNKGGNDWITIVSPISWTSVNNLTKRISMNITQLITFDVLSCTNAAKKHPSNVRVVSLRPLNSSQSLHTATNDIHEEGVAIAMSSMRASPMNHAFVRTLRQVTNNPPRFEMLFYSEEIEENNDVGITVDTVHANDPDTGINGQVTYSLLADSDVSTLELFHIDPSTGRITVTAQLDHEQTPSLSFRVQAVDGAGETGIAQFNVEVIDQNDNVPTFQQGSFFNMSISESTEVGSSVVDFIVIDEDSGNNGLVSYTLLNDSHNTFTIISSGNQATLSLFQELDYETSTFYHLTVLVHDGGNPAKSSSATVDIHITDVADTLPMFNASTYTATLPENTRVPAYVLTVYAVSSDSPPLAGIQYFKVDGDFDNTFSLDINTGVLTLFQRLDFESSQAFVLRVQAQSLVDPSLRSSASVHVTIGNVNDHTPSFSRSQYSVSVLESVSLNAQVVTVAAEDLDSGEYGIVTYMLQTNTEQDVSDTFNLDRVGGVITTIRLLDREVRDMYTFTVVASDGGTPPLTSSVVVVIRVTDVNDERPMFDQLEYFGQISENEIAGSEVVTVSASDSDTNPSSIEYFIQSGNLGNTFTIGTSDGVITTRFRLDREERSNYTLTVMATDLQFESLPVFVHINVTDVNDMYPIFQDSLYTPLPFPETVSVETVLLTVHALDRDDGENGRVTYTSADIDSKFTLHPSSGAITLTHPLDYESTTMYVFTVRATDNGVPARSSSSRVQITVRDENDNAPMFTGAQTQATIEENMQSHTSVVQLSAMDADTGSNSDLTYAVIGDSVAIRDFGVYQSGLVYTLNPLDRERNDHYQVKVRVSDRGVEPLSNDITINVDVSDVIDYPPMFTEVVYNVLITESTPIDSVLVSVSAMTFDLQSSLFYDITSGGNSSLFAIRQQTGEIYSVTNLDPIRHAGVYTLQVTAQHFHLSRTAPVVITIMKDDGVPRLEPLTVYFNVYESQLSELNYLSPVRVSRPKDSLNYTFSLAHSNLQVQRYFTISESNGDLIVGNTVLTGHYRLNVTVSTSTGVGHGLVEVFVRLVSNSTLRNAVVATFDGVREASFVSLQLEQFASFLTETFSCSREDVELFSLVTVANGQLELAFAVRDHVSQYYIDQDTIVDVLQANLHNAHPSSLLEFGSDRCISEPCPNLQLCLPVIELLSHSLASPYHVLPVGRSVYFSQPFKQEHKCVCPQGYDRSDLCSTEIDLCDPSPCYFDATCVDDIIDYVCDCPHGTFGKNCSIVCPSSSCDPCEPNPCLYEGVCSVPEQNPAHYSCGSCLWGSDYSGPDCELTSLTFVQGSFVAFPKLLFSSHVKLSFQFSTVSPSGLLIYSGRGSGRHDYIAIELVIGQIKVGVSYGDEATIVRTESPWQLNDARWHSVEIELRNGQLFVSVSECGGTSGVLQGVEQACLLSANIQGDKRTLDLTTPLYIGGLESHIRKTDFVSSTSFTGCLGNVVLGGSLLDLSSPLRAHGVDSGCGPLDEWCGTPVCSSGSGTCVSVWNGTVCSCEGETPLCQDGSSVQLAPGFINLQTTSTITLSRFSLAFRTRSSNAVLVQFGSSGSLELIQGSVQYRRNHDSVMMVTALTVTADGYVNDGYWHSVTLTISSTDTKLSLDSDRVVSRSPEGGTLSLQTLRFGAEQPLLSNSRYNGCLGNLVINSQRVDLAGALTSSPDGYVVTYEGAVSGCGSGAPCSNVQCPAHSTCVPGWREYTCVCDTNDGYRVLNGQCSDPCSPNPCRNGGTCFVTPITSSVIFQCDCESGYTGVTCEEERVGRCAVGFYGPSSQCQRCRCDPRGVVEGVICDRVSGECQCKPDGDYYSMSDDLGCQSCDCHVLGSVSSKCDKATGQCVCRPNVIGRYCDRCATGFAGLDEQGCKESTLLFGSFALMQDYTSLYDDPESQVYLDLSSGLSRSLDSELYLFGLPGRFESAVSRIVNSSRSVIVEYRVANYFQQDSTHLPRPSVNTLASAVQVIVQSGWAGQYQLDKQSHSLPESCSQFPVMCVGCPGNMIQDGIICRPAATCQGLEDADRDGISDNCDNCTHTFNPDQSPCVDNEEVCPGGVASDVLWSVTLEGTSDRKPCKLPSTGYVTRPCEMVGVWGSVDTMGCLSVTGQQLLEQVASLSSGQLLSLDQLSETLSRLVSLTGDHTHLSSGSDIQVTGKLLTELTPLLRGYSGVSLREAKNLFQNETLVASNLLDSTLTSHWSTPIRDIDFSAENFMASLEQLFIISESVLEDGRSLVQGQLVITTFRGNMLSPVELQLNDKSVEVSLPQELTTLTTSVTVAILSNLGQWLPKMFLFNTSTINFTVATPLLSIQASEGSEVTSLATPINMTLPFRATLVRPEGIRHAHCVSWEYGRGWSTEGCGLIAVNHTHTTCSCTHLTIFTVLLPESSFEPHPSPITLGHTPEIFTYAVLAIVCLLLLATLIVLACLPSVRTLQTLGHMNLLVALVLTTITFLVGINRVEIAEVCISLGILLMFLLLSCLSWLVADSLVIARFMLNPPPRNNYIVYLIIVGWLLPVFLTGIPMGTVGIITDSFIQDMGHPDYCWLSPRVVYAFIAPVIVLLLLYVIGVLFTFVMLFKMKTEKDSTSVAMVMNKHKVMMALFVSMVTMALLVVTWVFGLLAVYVEKFLEYPFAIFYAVLAVFLFLVLCCTTKVRDACKAKWSGEDEMASLEATVNSSSFTGDRRLVGNYAEVEVRPPRHHHHHHSHSSHHHRPNRHHHSQMTRGYHNELSVLNTYPHPEHSPHTSHTTPTHPQFTDSFDEPLSPSVKEKESGQGAWFDIPDPTPLSPLTYNSENGSVHQESCDQPEPVCSQIVKPQRSHDPLPGSHDQLSVSHDTTTDIDHATSPSLSEIYQRGRGSGGESPQSYLDYTAEEVTTPPLHQVAVRNDPLWYRPRDSVGLDNNPLPYETVVQSPRSDHRTMTAMSESYLLDDKEEGVVIEAKQRSLSDDPLEHSRVYVSCQSSSSNSPASRRLSHPTHPSHSPHDRLPKLSLHSVDNADVAMEMKPNMSPRKRREVRFEPSSPRKRSAGRTDSLNPPHTHPTHVTAHRSLSDMMFPPSSHVSSGLPSSLQVQVGRGEKLSEGDTYHCDGPSSVKDGSSVFRHADGSETVQSLV